MKLSCKIPLLAVAAILIYQLMIPPVIGLADQGDYARLLGPFHLGPTAQTLEERYYRYFNRTYQRDPKFQLPGWETYSTQDLFVASAVLLNHWISKDGLLDIRVLSILEILAFLSVCYLLLRATQPLLPGSLHLLVPVALILIFCDTGYVAYFNSFYCEPSSYIFLLALVAAGLRIAATAGGGPKYIALFGACAILFVMAKPQNVAAGLILGIYVLRFRRMIQPRWTAALTSAFILAASIAVYWSVPRLARLAQMYNMVFMEMLPASPDPARELGALGLDRTYAKYSGSGAFAPVTTFWNPAFQRQFDSHVNRFTIVQYYLDHPGAFLKYLRAVLPRGTSLRAEGVGNFEKSAGYPPFARSRAFAVWSRFHGHYLARWSSGLLILLMLSVPFAAWIAGRAGELRTRLLAECFGVLALMAVAVFFTTALGDAHDIAKHMQLYNVLTDICLVFAAGAGLAWTKRLQPSVFFRNRSRSPIRLSARQKNESRSRAASST
jgi:hypothetical protein